MSALKDLITAIETRSKFKASSVTANYNEKLGEYDVYSYNTIIAKFFGGRMVYFDDTSHSSTTSKLQHLLRANYTINAMRLNAPKTRVIHQL